VTHTAAEQAPAQSNAADFVRLSKGFRRSSDCFVLQAGPLPSGYDASRVGFTITKKTGNAPERNRMRRRLRAAVSLISRDMANLPTPVDFVIVARRSVLTQPFPVLTRALHEAVQVVSGRIASRIATPGA
jgi:ribonuclease P protein component